MTHGTEEKRFRFSMEFSKSRPFALKREAANALGAIMTDVQGQPRNASNVPAGYTYLGQFIDHDITRDTTPGVEDTTKAGISPVPPDVLRQSRSPTLDLDSMYGASTAGGGASPREPGGASFSFAKTAPTSAENRSLPNDLHRGDKRVLIPDNRNDENLAVAQTHLLWMKFHNEVVELLRKVSSDQSASSSSLFERTKDLVIRHYQYIVIHDFIQRFVDADVFKQVFTRGCPQVLQTVPGEDVAMPLEFSGAAYRFGHSLVREKYEWNEFFNSKANGQADFSKASTTGPNLSLFTFTTTGGFLRENTPLPSDWIVNWKNFFELDPNSQPPQKAMAIDAHLSSGMGNIPGPAGPFNLAAANLRRGSLIGLPSGQDVASDMGMTGKEILRAGKLLKGWSDPQARIIKKFGFHKRTPLWFYILQEGRVQGNGNKLGKLGSRIVCETFRALVVASKPSILVDGWSPSASPLNNGSSEPAGVIDSMSGLLNWTDAQLKSRGKPGIIDPLADSPANQ